MGASCLVLAADDTAPLLPTVISRVARLRLGPVAVETTTAWLSGLRRPRRGRSPFGCGRRRPSGMGTCPGPRPGDRACPGSTGSAVAGPGQRRPPGTARGSDGPHRDGTVAGRGKRCGRRPRCAVRHGDGFRRRRRGDVTAANQRPGAVGRRTHATSCGTAASCIRLSPAARRSPPRGRACPGQLARSWPGPGRGCRRWSRADPPARASGRDRSAGATSRSDRTRRLPRQCSMLYPPPWRVTPAPSWCSIRCCCGGPARCPSRPKEPLAPDGTLNADPGPRTGWRGSKRPCAVESRAWASAGTSPVSLLAWRSPAGWPTNRTAPSDVVAEGNERGLADLLESLERGPVGGFRGRGRLSSVWPQRVHSQGFAIRSGGHRGD